MFWQYQRTESVTAHRALSASNQNDFSWRNRVSAWEGALQMMAERPWLGYGWNQPESFYGQYYSASRLGETMAIQMNDYLMFGATLGIPALLCFGMYLWLALTGKAESRKQKAEIGAKSDNATSKRPQGVLVGNRLRPESHLKATSKLPHGSPKLPQSQEWARETSGGESRETHRTHGPLRGVVQMPLTSLAGGSQ